MSNPRDLFFWKDWEADPGLRRCSLAAQGLWMRMLCFAATNKPKGVVAINGEPLDAEGLMKVIPNVSVAELQQWLDELEAANVFSRTRTGEIYSRRMRREQSKTNPTGALRQRRYRERKKKLRLVHNSDR